MFDEDRRDAVEVAHVGHGGGGWREIDRRMRRVARRRAALDAEEGELIVEAIRAEVHVHLGYGSFGEYLERACGYARRTARERVRVAETLASLPGIQQALADGEISFSAVRELSRVATPETELQWLDAVTGCTVREIEDAVLGHVPGDLPDERPDPAIETRRVSLALTPEAYALFREARQALEQETGSSMTDAEFVAMACHRVLAGGGAEGNDPPYQIAVSVCRDCKRGWQETGARSVELSSATIERMCCDATELGDVDGAEPDATTRSVPAAVRRAVMARDKHRCCVPGCNSARWVDVHHIRFRSQGGSDEMSNLVVLCGRHHQSLHEGLIYLEGGPGDLRVFHADGRAYGAPSVPARAEASKAADSTMAHVGRGASLEACIRAALRACPIPRQT